MYQSEENSLDKIQGQSIVNNKYTIHKKLHGSAQCQIYTILFNKSEQQIIRTIKIEHSDQKLEKKHDMTPQKQYKPTLKKQAHVLKQIFLDEKKQVVQEPGFPRMYEFGTENSYNYIVQDIYGPNLGQLLKLCGGTFTLRTVMVVGLQILDRIQKIHQKKFLYSNFQPQNFVVGMGNQSYLIIMIDFARAIYYKSSSSQNHIPYQRRQCDTQNIFSSINRHLKIQLSRRDDIQQFLYLLLFMLKGKLPWSRIQGKTQQQKNDSILDLKKKIPIQSLFRGTPLQLADLMYYARTIRFYQKPRYDHIRIKLWNVLMQTDYQLLKNNVIEYDWNNRNQLDYDVYRQVPGIKLKKKILSEMTQQDQSQSELKQQKDAGISLAQKEESDSFGNQIHNEKAQ